MLNVQDIADAAGRQKPVVHWFCIYNCENWNLALVLQWQYALQRAYHTPR